jgi:hypothetical protein
MRTQSEIQQGMTDLISELSKREVVNKNLSISEVMSEQPDLNEKWEILMKEAEELRSKGYWVSR